jgi:hypothetical protein
MSPASILDTDGLGGTQPITNEKMKRALDVRIPLHNGRRIQKLQALIVNRNHRIKFLDHGDDEDAIVVVIVDAIPKTKKIKIQTSGAPFHHRGYEQPLEGASTSISSFWERK